MRVLQYVRPTESSSNNPVNADVNVQVAAVNTYIDSISVHRVDDIDSLLQMIHQGRLTGSLTINFSQGSPAGKVEWRERSTKK